LIAQTIAANWQMPDFHDNPAMMLRARPPVPYAVCHDGRDQTLR